ncbi:MAG TPA: hypothetical protein VM686_24315 [Polyangiaceae bacterium]|jgi:hypothetical protein|nr:hypothetical protein [Polyangiaceae bacterium]
MTDDSHNLRRPATSPSGRRLLPDDQSPTIRTTPVDVDLDALPDQAAQYVAPTPVPRISEHKTIDMVPVRLAPEINPRNALTQRLTPLPPQQRAKGMLLGAGLAVFLLGAVVLGALLLGQASSATVPAGSSAQGPAPLAVPSDMPLPAAAVIREPTAITPQTDEPVKPAKAAQSAGPTQKAQSKGREVWLE